MSILNFPSSPNVGDVYTFNGKTWRWNGTAWKSYNALGIAQGGTGLTGIDAGNTLLSANSSGTALTYRSLIAGSGILITVNPYNVVFTSTATGGGGGTGAGTVDNGDNNSIAYYPSAGTLVTGSSNFTYNAASSDTLTLGGMTFVGSGDNSIQITNVGNGGQVLSTWNTLNSGLALDATNASLRIVGDTNAGTTLVDLGVYSNSGFPVGSWTSKYLFPKTTEAIFVNGLNIQNTTNTTNPSVGALKIAGGLGVSGSASIGQSIIFYNSSNSNYIAFKSGASSASTSYTLPLSSPAIGTSVLQSTSDGILSWVPMVVSGASGNGTVDQGNQYELGWYDKTGTAITSSGSGLTWNSNTGLLSLYSSNAKLAIGLTAAITEEKTGLLLENMRLPDATDSGPLYTPKLIFRGIGNSDDGLNVVTSDFGFIGYAAEGFYNIYENSLSLYSEIDGFRQNIFTAIGGTGNGYSSFQVSQYAVFDDAINVTSTSTFNDDIYPESSIYLGKRISGLNIFRTRLIQHPNVGFGITYVFPSNAPSGFNFLTSSTGGTLSWVAFGGTVHSSNINTIPYYVSSGNAITGSPDFINSGTGISIRYTTASTSSNTGALIVSGGVGIGGSLNISSNINIRSGNEFRIFESGNTNYFGLKYTGATQKTYTFPADTPGTGTSVLQSDTSGNLSWVPMLATGGGTGSGTVSDGLINQIAFYSATGTAVTGAIGLTYSSTTNLLTTTTFAGNLSATAATATNFFGTLTGFATTARNLVTLSNTASATDHYILFSLMNGGSGVAVSSGLGLSYNPVSSTLRVGGVGISGTQFTSSATTFNLFNTSVTTFNALYVGTAISIGAATGTFTVNNASLRANQSTASINSTSGSIIAAGGVGIGGSLNVAGTASNISNLLINNSVITSGSWAGSTITSRYGGTGLSSYTKGDLLVGLGNTLIPLGAGTNNYVLKADNTTTSGLTWGLVDNNSLLNSTFYIGSASTSIGSTIGIVAGAGISFLYSNHSITVYNRSGVLITSTYPVSPLQGDLFWHDEEGVLKIYYDDTDGPGQWVDANQRWGQGQYVTFPDLGAGDLYEVAYYSGAGHSVNGANNFTNNTSTEQVAITYGTGNTSKSTGALVVSGGVGIGGSLYANTVISSTGFIENVYAGGTAGTGTTIYPNWSNGSVQTYTITGNCWLGLPTNMPTGASLTLVVSQNATGGWAMTSDSNIKYAGGSKTISTAANAIDVINMFYTGSTYLAALTKGYS